MSVRRSNATYLALALLTTLLAQTIRAQVTQPIRAQEPASDGWIEKWTVPSECSTRAFHEARLDQLLVASKPARSRANVQITKTESGYEVRVTHVVDGLPSGTRVLEAPVQPCRLLDDSITLIVALMIDPEGAQRHAARIDMLPETRDDERVVKEQAPTGTSRDIEPAAAPEEQPDAPQNLSVVLGTFAGIGLGYGHAPLLYPKALFGVSLRLDIVAFDLRVSSALPMASEYNVISGSSVSYWVSDAALGAALLLPLVRNLSFGLGGAFGAAIVEARGEGFSRDQQSAEVSPFVSLLLSVFYRLSSNLEFGFESELRVPLLRDRFVVQTEAGAYEEAHRTTVIVPSITLLARVSF